MKKLFIINTLFILAFVIMSESCSTKKEVLEPKVRLETSYGDIVIKLYPETPLHRDNFMKLVDDGFYDGVLFHRVIAEFMIQTGDPDSKKAKPGQSLGTGDVGYTIPAEFVYPKYYHKKGALAAARQGDQVNPKKASSGCQFYIVEGRKFSDAELDMMEKNMMRRAESNLFNQKVQEKQEEVKRYRIEKSQEKLDALRDSILVEVHKEMADSTAYKYTEQQRADYTTIGGTPHLDGEYTVFGEVIEGLDIVDKISKVKTGSMDRPAEDIKILKAKRVK
ncbi:peptidylprolyl isomerase [Paludibacter sp. 221]|uniref:peptidylprolyl isomerase n=1 Tax=Paludibacter sp. 221 TaxID=2302939 RepID=UPI0013D6C204|nr:peptidylprolyl isomerase [Paludibacter sp. 221]NDV45947.1 peptidylprolyl isomerase [Paludibacter sp. 221]